MVLKKSSIADLNNFRSVTQPVTVDWPQTKHKKIRWLTLSGEKKIQCEIIERQALLDGVTFDCLFPSENHQWNAVTILVNFFLLCTLKWFDVSHPFRVFFSERNKTLREREKKKIGIVGYRVFIELTSRSVTSLNSSSFFFFLVLFCLLSARHANLASAIEPSGYSNLLFDSQWPFYMHIQQYFQSVLYVCDSSTRPFLIILYFVLFA